MKRILVLLTIILFSGIGMVWGQDRCESTGGITYSVNGVGVNNDNEPYVTITLRHHLPYEVTVHFYILYKGNIISGEQIKNIPAYDGKDWNTGVLDNFRVYIWEKKDNNRGSYSVKITQNKKCN